MLNYLKKPWILAILVIVIAVSAFFIIPVEKRQYGLSDTAMTTDYTGLLPEKIETIHEANSRKQLVSIVQQANKDGKKISIAGVQHSQGGHTYYKDGIVIDMKPFNKIINIDEKKKTVTVEAGALVSDIQQAVTKKGLALKVSQSLPIFSIGGSLSVNGHGRDIRNGSMASTVQKMTVITPTGTLKTLTTKENQREMSYYLGGYGLFGIIVDVTLSLTDNEVYAYEPEEIAVSSYETYLKNVLEDDSIAMHYARLSVEPEHFLNEMYVMNYKKTGRVAKNAALKEESQIRLSKLGLDLGRQGGKAETLFWNMQKNIFLKKDGKTITRNNAMRSESTFMEYTKKGSVEVLQEFFIPIDEYEEFVAHLKTWLPKDDKHDEVKLHNITLRILSKDESTQLNYAREPMIAFVLLIQHPSSETGINEAKMYIQKWTNTALAHGGTYYLPYYPYQTTEQFEAAYPQAKHVLDYKLKQDPNEVFVNHFYDNYLRKVAN